MADSLPALTAPPFGLRSRRDLVPLLLQTFNILFGSDGGGCAVADGGGDLAGELSSGVSSSENPRRLCLHLRIGQDVALLVVLHMITEEARTVRVEADVDEHRAQLESAGRVILDVLDYRGLYLIVANDALDDVATDHIHLGVL